MALADTAFRAYPIEVALKLVLGVLGLVAAVTVLAGAAAARKPLPAAKVVLAAIDRQAAKGHLTPGEAARYRATVNRTALLARRLPPSRADLLQSQLEQAAGIAPILTAPRALAVFTQLDANDDWFARHGSPAPQSDITDADGVVYRYFPGKGFEFHPLGNFAALNAAVASKSVPATAKLANALADRGVPDAAGGLSWEYYFDYSGAHAPWRSGFAQAIAAQSFARAAALDRPDAAKFLAAANAAYRTLPGKLVEQTRFGPWIRLYSFNHDVVLNAQLQTAISLADYAKSTSNADAAALAANMQTAAAHALPSFNTGYWSYYALPYDLSSLSYQAYVVQLLQTLARKDDRFADAATAFASFDSTAPSFKLAGAGVGAVTFWISKPSSVSISTLGRIRSLSVGGGWHTVSFALPSRPGVFPVSIHATDWAGNRAGVDALPIVHVASPPKPKHKKKPARKLTAAAAALPPLLVGAGLDQPSQAALALQQGFGAVRMTLVWPSGASAPDPGAVAALAKLPSTANLTLELYVSAMPLDDAGRAALAAYAAALAQQVPTLRDLVIGPGPTTAAAAPGYEAALASIYDAVKAAAPAVRVAGALGGGPAPKATLAAIANAYRASGRLGPAMDELAFTPAPAAGKNLWPLASIPTLISALASDFAGTGQPGAALPLILDGVSFASTIPETELSLYASPSPGLDEASQAAAYAAALKTVACRSNVVELLFAQLMDSSASGAQSGLFYPDGTPKTSLSAVTQAIAAAQGASRGCATASPTPAPSAPTTTTTPAAPKPKPNAPPSPIPAVAKKQAAVAVAASDQLAFPAQISRSAAPAVHLGCTAACLYLVTLQRARDGAPVLATRGAMPAAGARTVMLPKAPFPAGSYRFSVWIVGAANPGPVTVERSEVVSAR